MTPDQAKDVVAEIAEWTLEERRAYIANLERVDAHEAKQVKEVLKALWEQRRR